MVKRGLIVSFYFPPTGGGGVQRWVKLIKYLKPLGWEFSVISSKHNEDDPKDDTLLEEIPPGTKILQIPGNKSHINLKSKISFFNRSGYWQRWLSAFFNITDSREYWNKAAANAIRQALRSNDYDILILSSPPYSLAILASELSKDISLPIILDLRDPWTINPYKIHPTPLHRFLDRNREKNAIANIRYIISAYKSTIDDYHVRIPGFEEKKTLILPNGFDDDDFAGLKSIEIPNAYDLHIGFSGSFYSHLNTPDQIFAAIKLLRQQNINICFHHIGSSVQDLKRMAKKYDIENNLRVWGYKSHKQSLEILNAMDALCLILDSKWPNSRYTIGGKFYEYLRLRKPILALVPPDGEAAEAIRQTKSGLIVSDTRVPAIAQSLLQLLDSHFEFTWQGIEIYNRKEQAERLHAFLLNEVL